MSGGEMWTLSHVEVFCLSVGMIIDQAGQMIARPPRASDVLVVDINYFYRIGYKHNEAESAALFRAFYNALTSPRIPPAMLRTELLETLGAATSTGTWSPRP